VTLTDRLRRAWEALVLLMLMDGPRPVLGIVPMFQKDGRGGRVAIQDADQLRPAVTPKTDDPDAPLPHWLIIHRRE
jgi:hypothetical protein